MVEEANLMRKAEDGGVEAPLEVDVLEAPNTKKNK
jgi:hypothetical protein